MYGGDTRVMLCPCGLLASFGARVVRVCFVQLGRGAGEWRGVLDERCETQRNASHGFTGRVQGCTVADSLPCGTALPFCVDFFHGLHLSCKPVKAPRKVESLTC